MAELCSRCIHSCKQDESAKIIRCPRFQKRLSRREFGLLLHELDDVEETADDLGRRARMLIASAHGTGRHAMKKADPDPNGKE